MLVRRLLLLVAVLIALTALAGSIAPVPGGPAPTPTPTPAGSPGARQAPAPEPDRPDVSAKLSPMTRTRARRITARVGDKVSITVRDANIDTVALGDLDVEPVEPTVPAHFDVLADTPGSYPLILVDAGRRIGTLMVR